MSEDPADSDLVVNTAALEPLFAPWEEPNKHRVRAARGQPPEIKTFRRPSPIRVVNSLRATVKEWRELRYPGASGTTQQLLSFWFERPHRLPDGSGGEI